MASVLFLDAQASLTPTPDTSVRPSIRNFHSVSISEPLQSDIVVADMELDMVADMEVPKVAEMVVDNEKKIIMKKLTLTLTWKSHLVRELVTGLVNWT